jgi:hypothetical protein
VTVNITSLYLTKYKFILFSCTSGHRFHFLTCPWCKNKGIFINGLNEQISTIQLNMYICGRQKNSWTQQELSQSGVVTDTRVDYKCELPGPDGSSYQAGEVLIDRPSSGSMGGESGSKYERGPIKMANQKPQTCRQDSNIVHFYRGTFDCGF